MVDGQVLQHVRPRPGPAGSCHESAAVGLVLAGGQNHLRDVILSRGPRRGPRDRFEGREILVPPGRVRLPLGGKTGRQRSARRRRRCCGRRREADREGEVPPAGEAAQACLADLHNISRLGCGVSPVHPMVCGEVGPAVADALVATGGLREAA